MQDGAARVREERELEGQRVIARASELDPSLDHLGGEGDGDV